LISHPPSPIPHPSFQLADSTLRLLPRAGGGGYIAGSPGAANPSHAKEHMKAKPRSRSVIVHETPVPAREAEAFWGSDPIAAMLRELEIPYISLVPGATYRGLHDSIVNYLGNTAPQMVLSLHEENAIAVAHGYAKVTDRMIAAAVHANIGLLRTPMAVYNAWCDRAPILMLGATGPWDATHRRPW